MTVSRNKCGALISFVCVGLTLVMAESASAQRGFGAARIQLATLEKVQAELNLTEEQKKIAEEGNAKLSQDRRELFQSGGGDFAAMREKMEELNRSASAKLVEKLDEAQQERLTQLYIQVNGANALLDEAVGKGLRTTAAQQKELADARDENTRAFREAFQDFQDMSDEERRAAVGKLREEGDARLLAVLTSEQRDQFSSMKGKELELDLSQLYQRPGGGQDGGRNRPGRP